MKEEESQTEEERLIEREKVERAKEAERRRLEDEKGSDGDWELMRSSSSIALVFFFFFFFFFFEITNNLFKQLNPKAEKCEWLNDILYKFWRTSAQGSLSFFNSTNVAKMAIITITIITQLQ